MALECDRRARAARILAREYVAKPMHALFGYAELGAYDQAPLRPALPMLDLCCGEGAFGAVFACYAGLPPWTLGVDIDYPALQRVGRRNSHRAALQSDARTLPIASGSLRFIMSNNALHALTEGRDQALREVARVLAPGGQVVLAVATPHFTTDLLPRRWLRALGLPKWADAYAQGMDRRNGHLAPDFVERWREALSRAGLEVEHSGYFFGGALAAWWSFLAWQPLRVLAVLRVCPASVRAAAARRLEKLLLAFSELTSEAADGDGYLVVCARKPNAG